MSEFSLPYGVIVVILATFGEIWPAHLCMYIFEKFRVFWIYVTKTQVLIVCGILYCVLGSYLLDSII